MLRLTLAQMRRSVGRLVAGGIAILLGTGFLTATLVASSVLTRTTYAAVTTTLADADLVVVPTGAGNVPKDVVEQIQELDGVAAVHPAGTYYLEVAGPDGSSVEALSALADDPRLDATTLVSGERPAADDEVLVPEDVAERLGVAVGDTLTARVETVVAESDGSAREIQVTASSLTVSGLHDSSGAGFIGVGGELVVTEDRFVEWFSSAFMSDEVQYDTALVALADGASAADVRAGFAVLADTAWQDLHEPGDVAAGTGWVLRTQDEQAAVIVAQITGSTQQLTAIVAGFAGVALLVAGLVIANTFQVLVAQRTRTLALLRCVGASRGQLRRSVVLEAVLLGTIGGVGGVVLGLGTVQAALAVLTARGTDVPLPAVVPVTLAALLVPVVVGVLVTVVAALVPARAATRVSPLAALQPSTPPGHGERGGRARAWWSGLLAVGGFGGLFVAPLAASVDTYLGLAVGMLGGAVSVVAVLLSAVFWVPVLMRLAGRVLDRSGGPAARLAAANGVRNPRRTAATSSALLIGVTLVVMMATGAASTRVALTDTLDQEFAVDVMTGNNRADGTGLPTGYAERLAAIDGVESVAPLTAVDLAVTGSFGETELSGFGGERDAIATVLRVPDDVAPLTEGTIVVPETMADGYGLRNGDPVVATALGGGDPVDLTVAVTALNGWRVLVSTADLQELDPDRVPNTAWAKFGDLDRADEILADVEQLAVDSGEGLFVIGAAAERVFYQRVIDTLLAVVVGLLGVAVVISLVGVANTLSLSVLERRRESATLRALGLSRRQLRGTLAVEGVLIALAGSAAGVVLGIVYGWFGSMTLLSGVGAVPLVVPWAHIGIVFVVAVAAGLLASVLPGRTAARTPPVAALAVD